MGLLLPMPLLPLLLLEPIVDTLRPDPTVAAPLFVVAETVVFRAAALGGDVAKLFLSFAEEDRFMFIPTSTLTFAFVNREGTTRPLLEGPVVVVVISVGLVAAGPVGAVRDFAD